VELRVLVQLKGDEPSKCSSYKSLYIKGAASKGPPIKYLFMASVERVFAKVGPIKLFGIGPPLRCSIVYIFVNGTLFPSKYLYDGLSKCPPYSFIIV
jgi:hypothetical protein